MKQYEAFLLDLDGTIYRGSQVIPEAVRFVQALKREQIPFLYLTNNSSATPQVIAERLTAMGLPTTEKEVYTSSLATAAFLRQRLAPGTPLYIIGEAGLRTALEQADFVVDDQQPQAVVIGIDRTFSYDKLAVASRAIRQGALFVATNGDAALPTERGLAPGNGSLVAAIRVASGVEPIVIGKPNKWVVDFALQRLGTKRERTLVVGDNLHTDIEAAANSGMDSLLVLTGFSTIDDAHEHPVRPTYTASDLWSWWTK
ncbi:TIGR01457 family HAD-type hydrolase [Brevibacillus humidisoli]|uniref:TIGR01457 family HAD-type hydrolase n=1 Tax=Brevibacillus humidisoli TaxID=2895522 RepID=UPI001E5DD34B|nr:TIGR01457 family HAD-type hydrolase [Brevibacillus humidisoli]UFJ39676.1 TIGR01457 family HAD-type hydrolase [Brevibacillus humidisoli]